MLLEGCVDCGKSESRRVRKQQPGPGGRAEAPVLHRRGGRFDGATLREGHPHHDRKGRRITSLHLGMALSYRWSPWAGAVPAAVRLVQIKSDPLRAYNPEERQEEMEPSKTRQKQGPFVEPQSAMETQGMEESFPNGRRGSSREKAAPEPGLGQGMFWMGTEQKRHDTHATQRTGDGLGGLQCGQRKRVWEMSPQAQQVQPCPPYRPPALTNLWFCICIHLPTGLGTL